MASSTPAHTSLLIAGATGLVGSHCLARALREPDFRRVVTIGRREIPPEMMPADPEEKHQHYIVDLENMDAHPDRLKADAIICALGTTMRRAGRKEKFRQVDHDFPLALARTGRAAGARHFLLVSAAGADSSSRIFYNRVKGEVEEAVRAVAYQRLTIVRPTLLLGDRTEFRLGEALAKHLSFLMRGRLSPVHADAVAEVLVAEARETRPGEVILDGQEIHRRSREK